jgi:hypothetical protein
VKLILFTLKCHIKQCPMPKYWFFRQNISMAFSFYHLSPLIPCILWARASIDPLTNALSTWAATLSMSWSILAIGRNKSMLSQVSILTMAAIRTCLPHKNTSHIQWYLLSHEVNNAVNFNPKDHAGPFLAAIKKSEPIFCLELLRG